MSHYALDARTATPHFPGIGRYVSNLGRALAPQLAPDERLTVIYDPEHPIALPAGHNVGAVPLPASPFSFTQQWAVPRLLRRLRADLYHSAYVLMPYAPGKPTVLTVYDLIPLRHPEQSTVRARLLTRLTTRLALAASRRVIAISDATRRDYLSEFRLRPERITTVLLAADPLFRPQPDAATAEVRRKYSLPKRFALYLGSDKPHKNLGRLVEAWKAVDAGAQVPERGLVIAGARTPRDPESQPPAEALEPAGRPQAKPPASNLQPPTSNLRTITRLGPVPEADLPALYAAASVFVFPSLYEGFGLPVLEAMACGTPVICSNTSSLPEVAGDAALLVDPTDTHALTQALRRALTDHHLAAELRRRGLQQAACFAWEKTAAATLALYRGTL